MPTKTQAPYGLWRSPFSPKLLAQSRRLSDALWDTDSDTLVWIEGRNDRAVLLAATPFSGEAPRELSGELSVRAGVGYGGGNFVVVAGTAVFADGKSGRLYRVALAGGSPMPVTPAFGRYAAPRATPDGRFVTFVHHDDEGVDRLGIVDLEGKAWPQVLHQGHDFYAYNRVSPDGKHVAFVAWDHPNMPWDGTWLYVAPLLPPEGASGLPRLGEARRVAGSEQVAIIQPEFAADGRTLYFVSDESGIGNLHAVDLSSGAGRAVTRQPDADLGRPAWIQDSRTYALLPDGKTAAVCVNRQGFVTTSRVDLTSGALSPLAGLAAYTDVAQIAAHPRTGRLAIVGSSPSFSARVVAFDAAEDRVAVLARATAEGLPPATLSRPEALTWKTGAAAEPCYGLYYPPCNQDFTSEGRPPLIVMIHGGPTGQVRAGWSEEAQFYATRGYGVLYVNHRGSTGYGRAYMQKLRGAWGQVDVEDAVSGARFLADAGRVDGAKMVIMGGSAGGYTVLQTMVERPEAFAAGISLYGIANQFSLVAATHKFEARYNDSLLGPLPAAAELYRQRSPLFHAHKIKRPLAIFQGEKDEVVPKDQADAIVKALQRNGTPHVYHLYPGEGHGFRKAETIEHYFNAVDMFLREHVVYA